MKRRWGYGVLMLVLAVTLLPVSGPGGVESQERSTPEEWKTFADPVHGYSVRYPPAWQVQTVFENTGGEPFVIRRRVALRAPQGPQINIDVWERDASVPMEQWFREVERIDSTVGSEAILAGQQAYVVVQPAGPGVQLSISAYVPFGDHVVKIHYQHSGDVQDVTIFETLLRSFSLAGLDLVEKQQIQLPDFQALVPLTCGTNICPSTCWSQCTFAPVSEGCCGYHAVPKWQCSKTCDQDQIGDFSGNCVWWGAYTRPDVGALASGNAENWAISVRNTGQLPIDRMPKVGDIVVHPGGSFNHVAYVVWVSPDGTSYQMSDMGWCADCGPSPEETKLRSVDEDDEFIHCSGDPAIPVSDWTFADCPFGWTPSKGFSASELNGSGWVMDPAEDPFLLSPVISVSAGEFNSVEITMANQASDSAGRIYFTTSSSPGFDEAKVVSFATTSGGSGQPYIVEMSANPSWQGTITRLRLDPVGSGNGDGSADDIVIGRIRFVDVEPVERDQRAYVPVVRRDHVPGPANQPPQVPSEPSPPDGALDQPQLLMLTWAGGDPDGDAVYYDVYLDAGDDSPQMPLCEGVSSPACDAGTLITETEYYWKVVATDEHSAVSSGPVWAFTTTMTACQEGLSNGGFEFTADWEIPATAHKAAYTTVRAHSGDRSMRVGIVNPDNNVRSYSSARQLVTIPAGAESATLRFWLYTTSGEAEALSLPALPPAPFSGEGVLATDSQYVMVLSESGSYIETLFRQRRDDGDWTYHEVELADYTGQTIKLHFGVYNDGEDGVTAMYMDDVSLVMCGP